MTATAAIVLHVHDGARGSLTGGGDIVDRSSDLGQVSLTYRIALSS